MWPEFSKYILRNSISQNLQWSKENENNITFYWINFITSLLFFCKQFYNTRLSVFCLTGLVISWISKILPQTNFLQSKYYISSAKEQFLYRHAFHTSQQQQMKSTSSHQYLKMALIFVTRYQLISRACYYTSYKWYEIWGF